MSTRIVTDSTCDLPQELIDEHNITVMPLYINFGEQGFLDGVEITRQEQVGALHDAGCHHVAERLGEHAALQMLEFAGELSRVA